MKKLNLIIYILMLGTLFTFQSCSDEGFHDDVIELPAIEDLPWQATTNLIVSAEEEKGAFVWVKDLLTFEEYWGNDAVSLNVKLQSAVNLDNFSKIDFYVNVEEKDGYNYTAPYETEGKMIASVSSWDELGEFNLSLKANDVYALFMDKFQIDRSSGIARDGDLFEIHWVITSTDGSVYDSRESASADSRFSFRTVQENYAPPIFEGTFTYEWIAATAEAVTYGKIAVGQTGTIEITHLGNQVYSIPNLGFNYFYAGAGTITFDFLNGLVTTQGNYAETWKITKVEGPTITIDWSYSYSAAYNEYGTATLTRTDGTNWPANIHTN